MYILYHHPYSQHARRIVALFEEAGLNYDLRTVAVDKGEHLSPEYLAINPNHQVPTFIDGDLTIHESNAVLRYLCAKHGLKEWYPEDLKDRAMVDQWLDWNQCRLVPSVADIVVNTLFRGDQGDRAAIARAKEKLTELAAILDTGLNGREFLIGARPTIADLSVASNITQLGLADAAPTQPNITNWYRRVSGIGGFRKSLPQG